VAYLRYASVYHNYSLEDMEKELRSLNVPWSFPSFSPT
jgi:transcriptional regulator NrdR family protein